MATTPQPNDSHPICPTCENNLTGKEDLPRFGVAGSLSPAMNDAVMDWYEETTNLLHFLGAVAQAGPLAAAQYVKDTHAMPPDWMDDLRRLAEELTEEAQRRLDLLHKAGLIWQKRAEGKEG